MPKKAKKLSAVEVRRLIEPGRYPVGDGLILLIKPSGSRSWIYRYPTGEERISSNGKPFKVYRDVGLGGANVSLKQARENLQKIRDKLAEGVDPVDSKKRARQLIKSDRLKTITFEEAAQPVIRKKQREATNAKHAYQWRQSLEDYAFPTIGNMSVADIELPHIVETLKPIWETKNPTARRVRQRIETVLDWAKVNQYRTGDNPAVWKGNLDHILPNPNKIHKKEPHRSMPVDDMPDFWQRLQNDESTVAKALCLLILTGVRANNILSAEWSEIHDDMWIISSSKMKNRKEDHRVPLCRQALKILRSLPGEGKYIFTRDKGRKLSERSMYDLVGQMGDLDRTDIHGLRASLSTWVEDKTNTPLRVMKAILSHVTYDDSDDPYIRSDLMKKRAKLMQRWADYLTSPKATVVSIGSAR